MVVVLIQNGIVTQRWEDVSGLGDFSEKYGLSGPQFVVADVMPGMIANQDGTYSPPPPAPPRLVDEVSKLALVRAMRRVTMGGVPVGQGDTSAWDVVKSAISATGGSVQEDWDIAIRIPRDDSALNALLAALIPDQAQRVAIRDAVFMLAGQIEGGEVAP